MEEKRTIGMLRKGLSGNLKKRFVAPVVVTGNIYTQLNQLQISCDWFNCIYVFQDMHISGHPQWLMAFQSQFSHLACGLKLRVCGCAVRSTPLLNTFSFKHQKDNGENVEALSGTSQPMDDITAAMSILYTVWGVFTAILKPFHSS